ncbi:MAG: channel signal transduction response regulator [Nitrosarchaeum sp.]|jgi:DNA-binding response OmpR family regulator|nr:channel signal transduction response regulator [Nitrosarchaeum sp.]
MKLLIVDDNKDITTMLSKFLVMKGFDCTVSNDGKDGMNLIKKGLFDRVILDMSMPDFGGMDIINELEKSNKLKDNKIIIFTASSISEDDVSDLLKKDGVVSLLRKPVQLNELLTAISN